MASREPDTTPVRRSKWRLAGGGILTLAFAAGLLVWLWDWNWFRPLLEARLSAALGRAVTMQRLEVHPGRVTMLTAYEIKITNPVGFDGPDFATLPRLTLNVEVETWLRSGRIVVPLVEADRPGFNLLQTEAGENNWTFPGGASTLELQQVLIHDGVAHAVIPRHQADITATIGTPTADTLAMNGKGTFARQPITFRAGGGALLALRDANVPFPVDFALANGDTRITLKGTVRDPIRLAGADLNLTLSGPDMALLLPLTGIATPKTPPYQISGRLDFGDGRVRFTDMKGRVGSSDLSGDIDVDPRGARPVLNGTLMSRRVDMEDLGGFVGSTPGRTTTPGQTARQVEEVKRAEASPKLLPTTPISLPKVRAADIHLTYRGEKILGKNVPFDSLAARLDIDDGHIRLSPLRLGIGGGAVSGTLDLTPVGEEVDADADVKVEHVDISRLLASAGLGDGRGTIDGTAKLKGRGASLSGILGHGDGAFRAVMPLGGNVNALLVDLMGLEFGQAFFAAIGVPDKEAIRCMVADFVLQRGILVSRTLEVNTTDHVITGGGRIDLSREVLEMSLRTDSKHFTIGKLATPILISGAFKDLHFAPDKDLAIRGGVAAGLGFLFPPAALLPTIQFGVGDNSPCAERKTR